MPYMIRKHSGKHHVYKKGDNGQPTGKSLGGHRTRSQAVDQLRALYANEKSTKATKFSDEPWSTPKSDLAADEYCACCLIDENPSGEDKIKANCHLPIRKSADSPVNRAALRNASSRLPQLKGVSADAKAAATKKLAALKKEAGVGDDTAESGKSWGDDYDYMPSYSQHDGDDYLGDWQTPKLDPDDPRVLYDPLGGDKTNACANCAFYDADDIACRLVQGDIVAPGLCNLWLRELTDDEQDEARAIPVNMVNKQKRTDIVTAVKTAIKQLFGLSDEQFDTGRGFKTFGDNHEFWVAFFSNNAKDRDHEWFPEKAHDDFIQRLDAGLVPMPYLDFWHCKAYHGQAFWVDRIGHVMMAVGTFDESELADSMKSYYDAAAPNELLVSHGFVFPTALYVDNSYWAYNTFEISPLPADVASNEFTGFASFKEYEDMALDEAKRKQLIARLPPGVGEKLIAAAGVKSAEMDKVGTSFKNSAAENPLETQVKALDAKFDALLEAVAALAPARKAKKADPKTADGGDGTDEEDAADSGDDESTEDDANAKKKSRKAIDPNATFKQLAASFKQVGDALTLIQKQQNELGKAVNLLYGELTNPQPASRSPYTAVSPNDPALAALANKMAGPGGDESLPGLNEEMSLEDYGATIFGKQFFPNGRSGN